MSSHSPDGGHKTTGRSRPVRRHYIDPNIMKASRTFYDVTYHFWPLRKDGNTQAFRWCDTLNDSHALPGKLAYILLNHNAHPHFDSDGLIYVKSCLEVLAPYASMTTPTGSTIHKAASTEPADTKADFTADPNTLTVTADDSSALKLSDSDSTAPVPVFAQYQHPITLSYDNGPYRFVGYYRPVQITVHAPFSDGTRNMLDRKAAPRYIAEGRGLDKEWAEVKLVKDVEWEDQHGAPVIKKMPKHVRMERYENSTIAGVRAQMEATKV